MRYSTHKALYGRTVAHVTRATCLGDDDDDDDDAAVKNDIDVDVVVVEKY